MMNLRFFFIEDKEEVRYTFEDLPYIFRDPHKMDKKIDVKKLQFGSKIDDKEQKREDLFIVKNVLSANTIELNTGLIVKLLGIKPIPQFEDKAIEFLQEKFRKRKVFLKYDVVKYDSENILLCYVYLDNKTFINNHLVRTGLVSVDESFEYKCKKKFLEVRNNGKRMGVK